MDLGLKDATAVVVGGARGMGLATARCLAADGARVAVAARWRPDLDRAAEELRQQGSPDALGLVADVRDAGQVDKLFAQLGERWSGELNVLVSAVGPGRVGSFEDLTDEQWRQAFDDGVMGMVHCVRSALRRCCARRPGRGSSTSRHTPPSGKVWCCPPTPPPKQR